MFLGMGFSWTLSKALPYVLVILLSFVLMYIFRKKFKKRALAKWTLRLSLLIIPFAAYFLYSPIYEGDFSNNSSSVEKIPAYAELTGQKLIVISMPQCKFCYGSIDKALKLKERIPNAEIEYLVCAQNEDDAYLEWYQEKGGDAISVRFADSAGALTVLAEGRFPTFILVDGDKPLKKWSNDGFGVVAMDNVELLLK
jgi:hypothetical protein